MANSWLFTWHETLLVRIDFCRAKSQVLSKANRFHSFTATHFGTGNRTGQVGYHYGQYFDQWVALPIKHDIKETAWKMESRTLKTMGYLVGAE